MPYKTLIKSFFILVFIASLVSNDIKYPQPLSLYNTLSTTKPREPLQISIINSSLYQENTHLKKLLKLQQDIKATTLSAQIIAFKPLSWSNTLIIDKGNKDNIASSSIALNENGIIGQIITTQSKTSLISLLNNPNTQIPCITAHTKIKGILTGTHTSTIFKALTTSKKPLHQEYLLTLFTKPKSLPIGRITSPQTRKSEYQVSPIATFDPTSPYILILESYEHPTTKQE
ncbi:MAG: rod shape-determining protein MreC [Armatimonadetes bacterium]|nr:rod shape-determining protein MreC [Armatimonadota bacterium]